MPRSRRREEPEEGHDNNERWLLTYSDMITLLMVLFIVLFAISQVDQKRFEELKQGMAAGFGETSSPFQGSQAVMPQSQLAPVNPVEPLPNQGARPEQVSMQQLHQQQPARAASYDQAKAEVLKLNALRRQIAKVLKQHGFLRDVDMRIDERGLAISLVSRHIVFRANLADLTPRGRDVIDVLSPVLRGLPNQIDVDGHTNQVKVKPKYYPTDWELSAARAVTVLRYLHERQRVPAEHMSATAYG
ncbi:MAG: OmpA/MotB family protein, partial [Nocardioidaceae bacterium]